MKSWDRVTQIWDFQNGLRQYSDYMARTFSTQTAVIITTLIASISLQSPRTIAQARTQPRIASAVPTLCVYNGSPIEPRVTASNTYAWAVYASFDHPISAAAATVCFATATWAGGAPAITYTLLSCPIVSNGGAQIGGGKADFNGAGHIACPITTLTDTFGPPFALSARGKFPANAAFTVIDAPDIGFTVQRNAGCTLTLASRYDAIAAAHTSAPVACNGTHNVKSVLVVVNGVSTLAHRVNAQAPGSTNVVGGAVVPAAFTLKIGGPGAAAYTLDDVLVDPGAHSTGGN